MPRWLLILAAVALGFYFFRKPAAAVPGPRPISDDEYAADAAAQARARGAAHLVAQGKAWEGGD
jgi:hypothetical protein